MGIFSSKPVPKQTRNKKGQFLRKSSPPKPSSRIGNAIISNRVKKIPLSPAGFSGISQKEPTRPMGLKQKARWKATEQRKLTKTRAVHFKKMKTRRNKILKKSWNIIW